jgi:transcription initiation factor IIE alpha subunit
MKLFGKKKKSEKKEEKTEYVICPHCFLDYSVEDIIEAGGICPSCKGKIDLNNLPRAAL